MNVRYARLDRILFPTDDSDCTAYARRHTASLADRFEAVPHVIHVEEPEAELADVIDMHVEVRSGHAAKEMNANFLTAASIDSFGENLPFSRKTTYFVGTDAPQA